MPGAAINDRLWAEMTPAQKGEAVGAGRATLRQMIAGVLDGPDELAELCREFLTRTDASLKQLTVDSDLPHCQSAPEEPVVPRAIVMTADQLSSNTSMQTMTATRRRRRLGLPRGYLPRLHGHERLVRAGGAAFAGSGARVDSNESGNLKGK